MAPLARQPNRIWGRVGLKNKLARLPFQHHGSRLGVLLFLVLGIAVTTGCATVSGPSAGDPLEPLNRGVYTFNDAVDRAVLKPVATVYRDLTPKPVRSGIRNFFGNLQDLWSTANNVLQFKGAAAGDSLARFGVNTFIGLGGIFDIATDLGIERHPEDFGQTLGYWGMGPGPYLVLPLLGPSTLRDTLASPVDRMGDLSQSIGDPTAHNSLKVLSLVETRAGLLRAGSLIEGAALDPYSFTRDVFLQRRRDEVFDGEPPDEAVASPSEAP